ncbi:MAG: hypothetical protein RL264_979 [Bacteroidota bacterium]|jgi:hypothetical protein
MEATLATLDLQSIENKLVELKSKLTGDMFNDMEIRQEMHELEMMKNGVSKPDGSPYECFGCGS